MSDLLLAKPKLPEGWIDCSVGEPYLVRKTLFKYFDVSGWSLPNEEHMFEYPPPNGYAPLVRQLEDKHNAPVIITNGAKQALGAVFYALIKLDYLDVAMRSPYWALIPPLAKMHGLNSVFKSSDPNSNIPYLYLGPNNPDGFCESGEELKERHLQYKERGIPFIHDAVYYTRTYMPQMHDLTPFGDVQIYSLSKMLGLSGLRVGYVVCHDTKFYKLIQQYMEAMTVGVSIVSQMLAYDLLTQMKDVDLLEGFENASAMGLEMAKYLIQGVDPEVLEVPDNFRQTPGMFGFFKAGPKADFARARINIIDGALFGVPGRVRMNLAFNYEQMQDIVNRLNSVKA